MDKLQTTVPAAIPDYPRKHRCPQCRATKFGFLFVTPWHVKAVCDCGWTEDVIEPDSLTGHIMRRVHGC